MRLRDQWFLGGGILCVIVVAIAFPLVRAIDWQFPDARSPASLTAVVVAYADFRRSFDFPLRNYTIEVTSGATTIEVGFLPKLMPHEANTLGGEFELGKAVRYVIDRRSFSVRNRFFTK